VDTAGDKHGAFGFVVALVFSLLVLSLLNSHDTLLFVLFFAQGCFFTSYVWRLRGRADTPRFLFVYWTVLSFSVFLFALSSPNIDFVMTFAAGLSALMFFAEELRMARLPLTFERGLLGAGMFVAYVTIFLQGRYALDLDISVPVLVVLLALPYAIAAWRSRFLPASDMLFILMGVIPSLLFAFQLYVDMASSLGFLLIFYCTRLYTHDFGEARRQGHAEVQEYLKILLVVNTCVFVGYSLFVSGASHTAGYLFARDPFLFWLILYALFALGSYRLTPRTV